MIRIVLDCSTLLSGIFYPRGIPREVLRLWQEEKIEICYTPPILAEYAEKIESRVHKFGAELRVGLMWLEIIKQVGTLVELEEIKHKLPKCRDSSDQIYLQAAAIAGVDALVSSDKDLLVIKKVAETRILSPREFLETFVKRT